jgi:hypothetical protein
MSNKIPVDNGFSLYKLTAMKKFALTSITLRETSVGEVPLELTFS